MAYSKDFIGEKMDIMYVMYLKDRFWSNFQTITISIG